MPRYVEAGATSKNILLHAGNAVWYGNAGKVGELII